MQQSVIIRRMRKFCIQCVLEKAMPALHFAMIFCLIWILNPVHMRKCVKPDMH